MKQKYITKLLTIVLVLVMVLALMPVLALPIMAEDAEITEVSTWGELLNAVNSDKTHIKLKNDITDIVPDDELPTKHRLVFNGGVDYVLDLNGYELEVLNHANEFYTGGFSLIEVSDSSSLKIRNGDVVFDNYFAKFDRKSKGNVAVYDDSTLIAENVNMSNKYTGTVIYAGGNASVALDGGVYTVQNGFAIYLEYQASLTLDGGVYINTVMGDAAFTAYVDGYGSLYSDSEGTLTVNNALFKSGIQVTDAQTEAFSVATHQVTIGGQVLTEDIFKGTNYEAKQQNKEYYWYKWTGCALVNTESSLFSNVVRVISYEKNYPISVEHGVAKINGVTVTEASYGQEITIVADEPEEGMEFVRWSNDGALLTDSYSASTTFTMPAQPLNIEALYGKEAVKSVSVTVGDIILGQSVNDTEITPENGGILQSFEWREESALKADYAVFRAGKSYTVTMLVYPPEGNKFDENLIATVNGKDAKVSGTAQYAYIEYTFEPTPDAGFAVVYDTNDSQLGVGGKIVLDTALMASQSAEFKSALDAGKVTYQWYRNGEAIEGATNSVYNFTAEDVTCVFYASVTADGKTNYGHNITCSSDLYQVYLNATDVIVGEKVPQITVATPGVSIDAESMAIFEILGDNSYGNPQSVANSILIPGKSYLLVGKIIEQDGVTVAYGANVYVNGELMKDKLDAGRFFYEFSVPEADFPVYYTANGKVGIGVTLTVDTEKMCQESGTFKNAYDKANPTYQTVFYQWYKNGEAIKGATDRSYTVKSTDRDSYINCKVSLVDGKYGIGEQHAITNVVTVFNVNMPIPKDGETRISSGIYVDGVGKVQIMWWPKETGAEMQGNDTYVEGTVYEYYILFSPEETFAFADAADRTVYIYGKEATYVSGYAYTGEVTAIHKHQYSDTVWDNDEYCHWQPCIVPNCPDPNEEWEMYTEHAGGTATCQTKGECAICGAEYLADHDFSVPDYQYVDDMKCANFCENCDVWADWSYHEGGVSDCQNKSVCEICHHEYGELGDHVTAAEWKSDAENHWHECSLCAGQQLEKAAHEDTDENGKCDFCEYVMTVAHTHDHGSEWKTDEDGHWNECACGDKANKTAHADENGDGKCDICEYLTDDEEDTTESSVGSDETNGETDEKGNDTGTEAPENTESDGGKGADSENGGCGSSFGAGAAVIAAIIGFAVFALDKKRR